MYILILILKTNRIESIEHNCFDNKFKVCCQIRHNLFSTCIEGLTGLVIMQGFVRGRPGGQVVSALDSGSRSPGSSPVRVTGACVVFLGMFTVPLSNQE